MFKIGSYVMLSALALAISGCTFSSSSIPYADIKLDSIATDAQYVVIGQAVGTSSGVNLFGLIPVGGEDKSGSYGKRIEIDPVRAAAMYNAIESVPDADGLIAPRWHTTTNNYLIYTKKTTTVKGKAIKFVQK